MRLLHADALFTGDSGLIHDAGVLLSASGEVREVGRASVLLPRHRGAEIERVAGVLLPGLVNAHTHVELSALRGRVARGGGFVAWVNAMVKLRVEARPEEDGAAIARAADELWSFCTAGVGDVTNSLAAIERLAAVGIEGCAFHEVFGIHEERFASNLLAARQNFDDRRASFPTAFAHSLTPHTLYTTHAESVRRLVAETRERGGRLSVHLAEHEGERRYLSEGKGPVAEWYKRAFGMTDETIHVPHMSPVLFAESLGLLARDTLLVHLTDAGSEELRLVAERGAEVVLCPRSNDYIEGRFPPVRDVLAAGLEPALGTDSLASNSSLDVLAEARALGEAASEVPAWRLLQMATWNGARALGLSHLGRIAQGASPGIWALRGDIGDDPCAFVLANVGAVREWIVPPKGCRSA